MRDGFISMGHGRALINIDNPVEQLNLYEQILKKQTLCPTNGRTGKKHATKSTNLLLKKRKQGTPTYINEGVFR